jgi:hypothetical protein
MVEVAVRRARHDINFQFAVATRAGAIIQIAIRPDPRLAIFILPGKLQPTPALPVPHRRRRPSNAMPGTRF